jgi:hypothetical protein
VLPERTNPYDWMLMGPGYFTQNYNEAWSRAWDPRWSWGDRAWAGGAALITAIPAGLEMMGQGLWNGIFGLPSAGHRAGESFAMAYVSTDIDQSADLVSEGIFNVTAGTFFALGGVTGVQGLAHAGAQPPPPATNLAPAVAAQDAVLVVPKTAAANTIGLGLDEDLLNLRGTGAITYLNGGWQQAGLTTVDIGRATETSWFKISFNEAAQNAGAIRFDVSSFDVAYPRPGITSWELNQIVNNPSLLGKTTFIQNGDEVIWNGARFVKP